MPPIMSKPSKAAHLAIAFVTIGALIMVNTAIYYIYHANNQPAGNSGEAIHDTSSYWCASFFFSGLTLFAIGFTLGRIGRAARRAELPPEVSGERTAQPAVATPAVQEANGQVVPGQIAIPGQPTAPVAAVSPVAPAAPVVTIR